MLEIGSVLDARFRMTALIGSGSTGKVFLAENIYTGKCWAVKEIPKQKKNRINHGNELAFLEVAALRRLHHSGLASVADLYETEDCFYVFTDYVEGISLESLLQRYSRSGNKCFPTDKAVRIACGLAEVLCYLREEGVVHGDIKPSNIMIRKDLSPVLIDFGGAGRIRGCDGNARILARTAGYSPMEIQNGMADGTADLYAFGAVLYRMLSGNSPVQLQEENSPSKVSRRNALRKFSRQSAELYGLEIIIRRCTGADPAKRYHNAEELLRDIKDPAALVSGRIFRGWKSRILPGTILLLVLMFGTIFLLGGRQAAMRRNHAFMNCLEEANHCQGNEAAEYYRLAIMLDPAKKEGYLGLLNCLKEDNDLSERDDILLTEAMKSAEYDRETANGELLRANSKDYMAVAYAFAIAYCYCSGGARSSEALKYLTDVSRSGYDVTDPGLKERMEKSIVLAKIIRDREQIGTASLSMRDETKYAEYWEDMKRLVDTEDAAAFDTTSLLIRRDMLTQIYLHADELHKAGVSLTELCAWTLRIFACAFSADQTENLQAKGLKEQIRTLVPLVIERLRTEEEYTDIGEVS